MTETVELGVLGRLAAFRRGLGPELGAELDALASRLRLFEGAGGAGYFSHPRGLPVIALPGWAAARAPPPGAGGALDFAEAAAAGYLHVRVEDDFLDEGIGEPGAAMMLSGALFARHQALLARRLPAASPFWDLFEEVWRGYADAMLLERRLQKGEAPYDAAAFRRVLARSRPLVLPPAAVLFAAGREGELGALERLVAALAAAHQLFVDALDAEKDRALGSATHALFRLGIPPARGGDEARAGAAALRAALFVACGFDAIVEEARRELAAAEDAARALGWPEALAFLAARARYMADIQTRIYEAFFSGLLAPAGAGRG